jgi:hypothetical protein
MVYRSESDMRASRYHIVAAVVLGALLVRRPRAAAQDDAVARARALFAEGVERVSVRDLPGAEERFRAALALRDAASIQYNLASVLFEQGELTEAHALADAAAGDPTSSAEVREHARALREQIERGAGFLDVDTGGLFVTLTVDGYEVTSLTRPVPISAGASHEVVGRLDGVEWLREPIQVEAGEHHAVSYPVDDSGAGPVDEGETEPVAGGEPPLVENPFLWAGVGGGAALLLGVVIGAAVASSGTEAPVEGNFMPGVLRW